MKDQTFWSKLYLAMAFCLVVLFFFLMVNSYFQQGVLQMN